MTAATEAKGQALADRVEQVARAAWWVPSTSDPDGFHVVTAHRGDGGGVVWVCDCTAGEFGRPCSHIVAVGAWRKARAAQGK